MVYLSDWNMTKKYKESIRPPRMRAVGRSLQISALLSSRWGDLSWRVFIFIDSVPTKCVQTIYTTTYAEWIVWELCAFINLVYGFLAGIDDEFCKFIKLWWGKLIIVFLIFCFANNLLLSKGSTANIAYTLTSYTRNKFAIYCFFLIFDLNLGTMAICKNRRK